MSIYRLGHVEVRVPDLELASAYYTEVLGLIEVARQGNSVYLKGWDEHDHHSVILTYAPRYGIEHIAWKCDNVDDLQLYETKLEKYGCHVERIPTGEELAMGDGIRFETPSGHHMELYHEMEKVGNGLPKLNPPPVRDDLLGIAPPRLDHTLLLAENVGDAGHFMQEALDFRMTEQLVNGEGHQLIVFLERSHTPHDVAFATGTLEILLELNWVRPSGRKNVPGKPIQYVTTDDFLSHFNLQKLSDLPNVEELSSAGLIDSSNVDTSIFGAGKFFKEETNEKKENIYSNIDDMLNRSLKSDEE